jgi:hypothetical protein
MFPRLSVVVCVLGFVGGCAAEETAAGPDDSGSGNAPSTGGTTSGSGGAPVTGGSSSSTAGTAPKAGTSSGGSGTGTAGTSAQAGNAGSGVGGGSGTGGSSAGGSSTTGGTSSGGQPSLTLPFTEDFEDGTANGFLTWNEDMTAGKWNVVADGAGKIYQPVAAVADLEFAVGGSSAWTDVAFKVKVRLTDDQSGAQVVLRFKDPKTYLVVEIAQGKYKLRARADGSTTDLINPSPKPTIVAGTWYTVGITAKGTNVTLTLDNMPIGSPATCNALISNGGVALGVAEGSASFDDLSVTAAP